MSEFHYDGCKNYGKDELCRPCRGRAYSEQTTADKGFWRGLRLSMGRPMGPLDPGDTTDLWRDGE